MFAAANVARQERDRNSSGAANERPSTQSVLIVDDEEIIRMFLGQFFRRQDLPCMLAPGGAAAVEIFRQHADDIGLVLLDVRMPECDGPRTLELLQRIRPDVRCYFMSGDWRPYSENDLLQRGAAGLIAKPIPFKVLTEVVQQWRNTV